MYIVQIYQFKQASKKLAAKQKSELDQAVRTIINNPIVGDQKKGAWIF